MVVRSGKDIKIPNLIPKDQKIKGKSPNLLPHLTITVILYIADTDTHTHPESDTHSIIPQINKFSNSIIIIFFSVFSQHTFSRAFYV